MNITLYGAALWVNKDKPGEFIKLIDIFPTREEADALLSQVDSEDYIILELDGNEVERMKEMIRK